MISAFIDEKNSTYTHIEALGLSDLERSRALKCLAKADALVDAFFAARKFLRHSPRQVVTRPSLKSQ